MRPQSYKQDANVQWLRNGLQPLTKGEFLCVLSTVVMNFWTEISTSLMCNSDSAIFLYIFFFFGNCRVNLIMCWSHSCNTKASLVKWSYWFCWLCYCRNEVKWNFLPRWVLKRIYLYIQANKTNKNTVYSLCSLLHVPADFYGCHQIVACFALC